MSVALVWFRQDLRCDDNPALKAACDNHDQVIPLYIYDSQSELAIGEAQRWWLYHSLLALSDKLKHHQLNLCLRQGQPKEVIQSLIQSYSIKHVYWNHCYEPFAIQRDKQIKSELQNNNIEVFSSNGSLLNEPWEIKNQSDGPYKVFTPYWKICLTKIHVKPTETGFNTKKTISAASDSLDEWSLLPKHPNWADKFSAYWQPGEQGAKAGLEEFIRHRLNDYKKQRDYPAKSATSRLSPHLHFGEISPQQIWREVQFTMQTQEVSNSSAEHFLSEIGWREFSYHLLYHFPDLPENNFRDEYDAFPWVNDTAALKAWKKGLTGYPLVDAGMRELWETGYMHNRVRMIVASFLTKDLLIHWHEGADWFWKTLLDADLANNSASWQWVAGSGADAAPYYRIFNPVVQSERFDSNGIYIKQWVPELSELPVKWIHKPWETPLNCRPKDYPAPIVNHSEARKRALAFYQKLKK